MLNAGIAGNGTIYTSSNANWMISLNTATGAQNWAPAPTTAAVQGWLTWIPDNTGVAYWKFDDGGLSATASDSSGTNIGTLNGGPSWVAGKIGQALSFNGTNQYVSVPDVAALNAYPLTVAAWFKTGTTTGSPAIVNKYVSASMNGYNLFFYQGSLCAWYFENSSYYVFAGGAGQCTMTTPGFNNNNWHHVVFTVDGSGGKLYVDGTQQATQAWNNPAFAAATSTTQPLSIGYYPGTATNPYFPGTIDEVRIYNRALSAAEVSELYALTTPSSGGSVIGGDQGGNVYSLDATSGVQNWTTTLAGVNAVQAATAVQVWAWSNAAFQSAYSGDVMFAATRNGSSTTNTVYALKATDGTVLWNFNTSLTNATYCPCNIDYIVGEPLVDYGRNRLYVASRGGATPGTQSSLWVINSLNGAIIQQVALTHLQTSPTLSYDRNTIYVANVNNAGTAWTLYAIDATTFATRWTYALTGALKGFVWEDPSIRGRLYLSTADGNAWGLVDSGGSATLSWKTAVAGASNGIPLDAYYVASSDGTIHMLNFTTGALQKTFPSSGTLDGANTLGDLSTETGNELFVGTSGGKLFKIPLPLP